ncbi:MAG: hypothetical protein IIA50_06590 [Bacteroidetes bacterium]|nr:hypothetical protein [Bacteroidota bacterium]
MIAQLSLLMVGFGVTADRLHIVAGSGFVFLVKWTVPNLFFTDLGIREGAAAFVFEQMGGFGGAAVSAALCLYAINLVIPALLGVPQVRKTPDS